MRSMRQARAAVIGALALLVAAAPAFSQEMEVVQGPGSADYQAGTRWAPYKINDLVYDIQVNARWIEGSEKFWYDWDTSDGTFHYIVDPVRGTKTEVWDRDYLAAEITRITRDPYDAQHLPIRAIRFIDENTIEFEVQSSQDEEEEEQAEEEDEQDMEEGSSRPARPKKKVHYFRYDLTTRTLTELQDHEEPDNRPSWANISPDGQTIIFEKNDNLHMMTAEEFQKILDARQGKSGEEADKAGQAVEVEEIQLTTDGERDYDWSSSVFGGNERGMTEKEIEEKKDWRKRAGGTWSKDSSKFALIRTDRREVGDLWVIHSVGNERPELERYTYDMPGEENVTQFEIKVLDVASRDIMDVPSGVWQDEMLSVVSDRQFFYPDSREARQSQWLSDDSNTLWYTRTSRDRHRIDLVRVDLTTMEQSVVIEERLNTYLESRRPELLANGDLLWWSERDGWAHIYRYGQDGTMKNRLTSGPFSVRSINGFDDETGRVFFTAAGREDGEDPYYQHMYRVNIDGSGLTLLNPGDFDHRASLGPSTRFFVDNYSRVNTVPNAVLRDANGREVLTLEEADFSQLEAAGWQMPEPYVVKAEDGITNIYGNMYKPFDFDPNKKYPIIAYVYPGPQTEAVSKYFSTNRSEVALAQFGFIVVTMGNRGGHPSRSKWYHNYGYGNLRDYGLADKKATIEQLADRHDFIDIDRVGIYGHSGGGFMSTAAMLVYPDFFHVAVSSAGNHNNDVYNRNWSETHHGVDEVTDDDGDVSFEYTIAKNSEIAANLKGHLMLTTGDVDNNVHMAGTLRMAEALIRANKRFDFFIFPGQRHGFGNMSDYWHWLRAEYFVKHLLGDSTGWSADIVGLQGDRPRSR